MNLGTHMPGGERRKSIDIEDRRTKVKVTTSKNRKKIWFLMYRAEAKKVSNVCSILRSCDLDLCPRNLTINRLPPLSVRYMCTKFHLDPTFCS
jgi:hypothetical protein